MDQFVKIYGSIIRSTVWQTPAHVKLTWVTMLILADSEGRVEGSVPGLAATAGVSIEQCEEALALFLGPDKYSRTKEHEGRRIQEIRGGWLVLNHNLYRDLRTPTQVQKAKRQKRWEDQRKASGNPIKRTRRKKPAADAGETQSDAPDASADATDTSTDAPDAQSVSAVRTRRTRRTDPDPDPDPDPDQLNPSIESGSGRARARPSVAKPAPAAPATLARSSPEYFGDVQPATCKVPSDYVELERHWQSARELGLDLLVERERFRTHEYPRAYSDFHGRFDRWLLDARKFAETANFQRSQRKAPRAGVLVTQPSNGKTGWEHLEDDDDEPEAHAVGHA